MIVSRSERLLIRREFMLNLMRWVELHKNDDQESLVWLDRRIEFLDKRLFIHGRPTQ